VKTPLKLFRITIIVTILLSTDFARKEMDAVLGHETTAFKSRFNSAPCWISTLLAEVADEVSEP
jgi:hypothetical protein